MNFVISLFAWILSENVSAKAMENSSILLNQTRRILRGNEAKDTRPYMVYLRPSSEADEKLKESNWLCGGMIIDSQYILTSAACIEEVQHFVVISGTHRWLPPGSEDECIKHGAKKAVWKCVPKNYVFDGRDFDNIRWMVNDIAVVKVEDDFNFEKRIIGCDFIPKIIAYNNQSQDLEAPGSAASIAGWGSIDSFGDPFGKPTENSPELLETDVILISKRKCKQRWPERYHHVIDQSMICAKDGVDSDSMSATCREHQVDCKELVYSDETEDQDRRRRFVIEPNTLQVHSANHINQARRSKLSSGGFCENDHGGPLVVGHGKSATVVGIISACMTANFTRKCYGPFLYTSVWNNRHVIACAIDKEMGTTCRRLLESTKTHLIKTTLGRTKHRGTLFRSKYEKPKLVSSKPEIKTTVEKMPLNKDTNK